MRRARRIAFSSTEPPPEWEPDFAALASLDGSVDAEDGDVETGLGGKAALGGKASDGMRAGRLGRIRLRVKPRSAGAVPGDAPDTEIPRPPPGVGDTPVARYGSVPGPPQRPPRRGAAPPTIAVAAAVVVGSGLAAAYLTQPGDAPVAVPDPALPTRDSAVPEVPSPRPAIPPTVRRETADLLGPVQVSVVAAAPVRVVSPAAPDTLRATRPPRAERPHGATAVMPVRTAGPALAAAEPLVAPVGATRPSGSIGSEPTVVPERLAAVPPGAAPTALPPEALVVAATTVDLPPAEPPEQRVQAAALAPAGATLHTVSAEPRQAGPQPEASRAADRRDAGVTPRRADASLVADVQRGLNDLGINAGPADGVVGPKTRAAVRRYQRAVGQPADGVVDAALLQAIASTDPSAVRAAAARPTRSARSGPAATQLAQGLSKSIDELRGTLDRLFGLSGAANRSPTSWGPDGPRNRGSSVAHR